MFRSAPVALTCVLLTHLSHSLPVTQGAAARTHESQLTPFGPTSHDGNASASFAGSVQPHGRLPHSALSRKAQTYAALPLSFEPNRGQLQPSVMFYARTPNFDVAITKFGVELRSHTSSSSAPVRLELSGSTHTMLLDGEEPLPGKTNYLIGSDPKKWKASIPNFGRVRVRNAYKGIDLVYYGNGRQLEFDLVVAPGADPRQAQLTFSGVSKIAVDAHGDLLLHTNDGVLRQHKPVIYQLIGSGRREVAGAYTLLASNMVGFRVDSYEPAHTLVIDPVLTYSTYSGREGDEGATGIDVDGEGNVYIVGSTTSYYKDRNIRVQKINASGTSVLYTTLLGNACNDTGRSIAVDDRGNAHITGQIVVPDSSGYCLEENARVFVSKLDLAGNQLWGRAFGSDGGGDSGNAIALDRYGYIFLTGKAGHSGFPTTPGAFQQTGDSSAFVAKISPDGNTLVYSTYLGDSSTEGFGIAVDSLGHAHVAGKTTSHLFPTTANAYQRVYGGWFGNAFVTKLNDTGSALLYSTYLGGDTSDGANELAIDTPGNMYVVGNAQSANFPTTPGAYDRTCGTDGLCNPVFVGYPLYRYENIMDAFAAKINPFLAGQASLVYSTYLGGLNREEGFGIAVDANGNAWIAGVTRSNSVSFPLVDPIQGEPGGNLDGFLMKLNASGTALLFSTFLGGPNDDYALNVAVDSKGDAYVGGVTNGTFPTKNPFQAANAGGYDALVAKVSSQIEPAAIASLSVSPVTVTSGATSTGTVTLTAAAPAGGAKITLSSSTPTASLPTSILVPAGTTTGTFTVTTKSVAAATAVSISASYSDITKTASLSVRPVELVAMSLTPTSVTGTHTSAGKITLSGPAPPQGITVTLTSSNTAAASVPAAITVRARATTANLTVSTKAVGAATAVTISAVHAGVDKAAVLTVTLPCCSMSR